MIALSISEIKKFMVHLLSMDTFDDFRLQKAELGLRSMITIDGKLNKDYDSGETADEEEEISEYVGWNTIRDMVYQMIKGKKTPSSMNIILRNDKFSDIRDENVSVYYLNIKYEAGALQIVTGVAYKTFSMDKSTEYEWDNYVREFLKSFGC